MDLIQKGEIENTKAQMRKGLLQFCILLVISQGKIYASDILKELKKSDLLVVEGTMYPLLSRLKKSGLLEYVWEESKSGPPRKYYSLTSKGKDTLKNLSGTWSTLSKSINSLTIKFNKK
jgi:PadR family transcriptional regulator